MKRQYIIYLLVLLITIGIYSCSKSELEKYYADPDETSTATPENFFSGLLYSGKDYVMPQYWKLFVVELPHMGHYTQALGYINANKQYVPSSSAFSDRWSAFYTGPMAQFRQFEYLYNQLTESEKTEKRIFYIASSIFFFDQSAQMVDMFGDIPWSEAGKLRDNSGDLSASLPAYDAQESIYTAILDGLKSFADEFNTMTVSSYVSGVFAKKDMFNGGSVTLWQKYCNSLRLRLLMRVSGVSAFQSRATGEITQILNSPATYPVVDSNSENTQMDAGSPDLLTDGLQGALEDWSTSNLAPKAVIDIMVNNTDPRLPVMFSPNKNGVYAGVDPTMSGGDQETLLGSSLYARYDSTTFSRNKYFPGLVMTASEVSFLKAEAFQKGYASGTAKDAYESGIRQSIALYFAINNLSQWSSKIILTAPDEAVITGYLSATDISWDSNSDKMNLIATQKWLHLGIVQLPQTWAEYRRLNLPSLSFLTDNSNTQTLPPSRVPYPDSEKTLNADNYKTVEADDGLNVKIFWDVD